MFGIQRTIVGVVLAAVTALAVVGPSPAAAAPPRVEPPVDFTITGFRCEFEIVSKRTRHDGTMVLASIQSGFTESSIALMTGELTVRSTLVLPPDGNGRVSGRWTFEPEASTGSLRGIVRGSLAEPETTELVSSGHGIGALRGVSVRMTTTTPADGGTDACDSDLTFTGSGTASYRDTRDPQGAVVVESSKSFAATVADLTAAVEGNPNLRLVRTVDHQAAAASRGLVLSPTTELFFGNPALGTPLMQSAQTAGIDLPQKMLIWEDLFGIVRVGYNAPAYLESRHAISGADGQLQTVANALANLAGVATGTTVEPTFDAGRVRRGAGLVEIATDRSADEAFAAIVAALEAAPPVNVAIKLEHDANARSVGLDLAPTKLVVFGNPSLGTVLMQTDQSIALDLPQKILVYTKADGQTMIGYNDPRFIATRHDVRGQRQVLDTLSGALANFAAAGS